MEKCHYCGVEVHKWKNTKGKPNPNNGRSEDHMTPRCRGGMCGKTEKVIACLRCNNEKGQLTYEEYMLVLAYRRKKTSEISPI